jgi:hypothetical protein
MQSPHPFERPPEYVAVQGLAALSQGDTRVPQSAAKGLAACNLACDLAMNPMPDLTEHEERALVGLYQQVKAREGRRR